MKGKKEGGREGKEKEGKQQQQEVVHSNQGGSYLAFYFIFHLLFLFFIFYFLFLVCG